MDKLVELIKNLNPLYIVIIILIGTFSIYSSSTKKVETKPSRFNTKVKIDQPKVVDTVPCGEIENIAEFKDGKLVMCR